MLDFEIDELLYSNEGEPQPKKKIGKGILHLCGTKFSGKSTILNQIKNRNLIYDVASFYRKYKCIHDGKMDWKVFREVIHLLPQDVENFISVSDNSNLLIIESSGIGKSIKEVIDYLILDKGYTLHEIYLKPPEDIAELARRMSRRIDNVGNIDNELEYIRVWNREFQKLDKDNLLMNTDEAIDNINNLFTKYEIDERIPLYETADDYRKFDL